MGDTAKNDPSLRTKENEMEDIVAFPSTSQTIQPSLQESSTYLSNHMPQLNELSISGGTIHTDQLLSQIEELSVALKNFAPALKRLRLPICSNFVFKVIY